MNHYSWLVRFVLILFAISQSGCAALFSPANQKVRFTTVTPEATIFHDGDSVGIGTARLKLNKSLVYHTMEVEKKGFVPGSYGLDIKHKLSATAVCAAMECITLIFAPFIIWGDLSTPKVHRFVKRQTIPALTQYEPRRQDEKYLLVNQTSFNLQPKDIRMWKDSRISRYEKRIPQESGSSKKNSKKIGNEGLNVTNSIFTDGLNAALLDMGFIDTGKSVFTNADNSLYIEATITGVVINRLKRDKTGLLFSWTPNQLLSVQMEIEWRVLDYYKQPVYTTRTVNVSDLFLVKSKQYSNAGGEGLELDETGFNRPMKKSIAQNFLKAMIEVRKEIAAKGLLKVNGNGTDTSARFAIVRPGTPGQSVRMNEILKSAVTIKTAEGHGSGVLISADGYLVTNYHVIAGEGKPEVIFNDGSTTVAKVIKVNTGADLALLKVEHAGIEGLPLAGIDEPEVGIDVWAMGTPNSLQLGQSISKGIISGVRRANELSYIQTDVKVSPGNSGGALINRKGEVLGIVSSKMIGLGTEGVGFAIYAKDVLSKLNIEYK